MKKMKVLIILLLMGCASVESDWSSGSGAQRAYQQQRYQEQVESVRKQVPEARPNF